jgi:hypothetical protein
VEKDRVLNEKVAGIFGLELCSSGKRRELRPWLMDRSSGWFTMDQGHGHGGELAGAPTPSRFRPWRPDVRWGKGRGRYGGSVLPGAEAWEAARRRHTSGVVEGRRRRVGGQGCFYRGGGKKRGRGAFNGQR